MRFKYIELGADGIWRKLLIDDGIGFYYSGIAEDFKPKEIEIESLNDAQDIIDNCDNL